MSLWKIGLDLDGQVEDALKSHNADKRTLILVGHRRYLNRVKCSTGASEISVTSPPKSEPGIFISQTGDYLNLILSRMINERAPRFLPFDSVHVVSGDNLINGSDSGAILKFGEYSDIPGFKKFTESLFALAYKWMVDEGESYQYAPDTFLDYATKSIKRDDAIIKGWLTSTYCAMHKALFELKPNHDFIVKEGAILWNNGSDLFDGKFRTNDMTHRALWFIYREKVKAANVTPIESLMTHTSYLDASGKTAIELISPTVVYLQKSTYAAIVSSGQRLSNTYFHKGCGTFEGASFSFPATRRHMTYELKEWLKENKGKRCAMLCSTSTGVSSLDGLKSHVDIFLTFDYLQCLDDYDAVLLIEPPSHSGQIEFILESGAEVKAIIDPEHPDMGGASKSIARKLYSTRFNLIKPTKTQVDKIPKHHNNLFSSPLKKVYSRLFDASIGEKEWSGVVKSGRNEIIHASQKSDISSIQSLISGL